MNHYFNWLSFVAVLAGVSYGALAYAAWRCNTCDHQSLALSRLQQPALIMTATVHSALLFISLQAPVALGYAQGLSLAACVGVWLFIIESRFVAIDSLRPLALSLPALAVVLGVLLPASTVLNLDALGLSHVLVGIAAHGVALLAAGHAVLLFALNQVLRQRQTRFFDWAQSLSRHCPPLVVLEHLLIRQSIWVGALLAITVSLGLLDGIMQFNHKTLLTMASLLMWFIVPYGYQRYNWRAWRLCLAVWSATAFLLLAYIGSRFVLHVLLDR
jgi:ABC-type uncharacterized transport system permease subunit